jgi:hypothetical protein
VLVLSLLGAVWHLSGYDAGRLLLTGDSAALVVQVLVLCASARLLRAGGDGWGERAAMSAAIAANLLTLAWLSHEAVAHVERVSAFVGEADRHFVLSSTSGLYAGALLLLGIAKHHMLARLRAIAIFGIKISKLVLVDL